MNLISILLASVLLVLSLIHVYWAFGGKAGLRVAVPHIDNQAAFKPGSAITFVVAIILLGLASLMLLLSHFQYALPERIAVLAKYSGYAVSIVFFLRSVGDFKLVGFFKKVKQSRFATLDTYLYNPLCFSFGVVFFILAYRLE